MSLYVELDKLLLPTYGAELTVKEKDLFLDLLWGIPLEQIDSLDPAVFVDAAKSTRRMVVLRVHSQCRYWLTTDRDPAAEFVDDEIGWVDTAQEIANLCVEFLVARKARTELKTARRLFRGSESE